MTNSNFPDPGSILCAGDGLPDLVVLPGGSFQMGGSRYSPEQPVHSVHIISFAIGKYPVTQAQWTQVMGHNPSQFPGRDDQSPVDSVNWRDAQAFIQRLNQLTGHAYRLPSEAEWEYACRAGSTAQWYFGDDESQLPDHAWYDSNSGNRTHPVGKKEPNAFGLYDMHGNVYEWCEDHWHDDYQGAPTDGSAWVTARKRLRVLRGGNAGYPATSVRSASRGSITPVFRHWSIGFRLARTLP